MITREVEVTQIVRVTIDETKFTPEVLEDFRRLIDRSYDTLEDHIRYLAWLHSCRSIDETSFIEGYGRAKDFGITFDVVHEEDRLLEEERAS